MSDAPEKIWAYETPDGDTGWLCNPTHRQATGSTEYTRSDIAKREIAELRAERDREYDENVDLIRQLAERDAELARARKLLEGSLREYAPISAENHKREVRDFLSAQSQPAQAGGWRDMSSAPKDGTRILVLIFREACLDMDDVRQPAFAEVKEVFYKPYVQFGMSLPWHSGDPFDSHEGMAPEHMGEALPVGWLPRNVLPAAPTPAPAEGR